MVQLHFNPKKQTYHTRCLAQTLYLQISYHRASLFEWWGNKQKHNPLQIHLIEILYIRIFRYSFYLLFSKCHVFTLLPFQGVDIIFLFHIPRVPLRLPWAGRSIGLSARLGYRLSWVGLIAIYLRAKERIFEENSKRAGVLLRGFEADLYFLSESTNI